MKKLFYVTTLLFLTISSFAQAQKIANGETLDLNGLSLTFNITNKETTTVSGKNFDRYVVSATLVNNSQKSYNKRVASNTEIVTNTSVAEINCINATGAKLTSKRLELKLKQQMMNVTYMAYNKNGKYESFVIPVISSYFFEPGETITDNAIFIVPQGEALNLNARKLQ